MLVGTASADVVVLRDGTELVGEIKRTRGGYDVTLADGTQRFVPDADVQTLRIGAGEATSDVDVQLTNLRRSVEPLDDLALIIERYRDFLARHPDADAAREELALWEQWQAEGRVRFNDDWVTPDEQRRRATENLEAINEIRGLVKSGQSKQAMRLVRDRLRENPREVSSHYMLGLLQTRAGNLAAARRSFEEAAELAPGHAPTANNLAVVLVKQNQYPRALLFLGQALRDAPDTKSLLDNAAELLELTPADRRDTEVFAVVKKQFETQDAILGARLAQQGWHRFGSKWIDAEAFAEIERQRALIAEKIAALEADFTMTSQRITAVEREIAEAEVTLEDIRRNSLRRLEDGRIVQLPLPDVYFEIEREQQRDERDLTDLRNRIGLLREEAQRVRAQLPQPLFDGELKLIGADGVPVVLPLPE
ncbi:MAG: tetratricopeptide repeat protein [Planctomycetota bacterium]